MVTRRCASGCNSGCLLDSPVYGLWRVSRSETCSRVVGNYTAKGDLYPVWFIASTFGRAGINNGDDDNSSDRRICWALSKFEHETLQGTTTASKACQLKVLEVQTPWKNWVLIENELYRGSRLFCGDRFRGKKEPSRNLTKTEEYFPALDED